VENFQEQHCALYSPNGKKILGEREALLEHSAVLVVLGHSSSPLCVWTTGQSIPEAARIYARYWTDIWLLPDSRGRLKWLKASFVCSSDESSSAKSENLALKYTNYNNNILGQRNKLMAALANVAQW